ncbi:MAG: hypothetical protein JNK48_29275 [Bryobacterales bacterium]|nr:hypothetical protein [Bryobacterales bacterium]
MQADTGAGFARRIPAYLPNLVVLAIVWTFTYMLIRVSRALSQAIGSGTLSFEGFHKDWAAPTHDMVRILLIMFGFLTFPGAARQPCAAHRSSSGCWCLSAPDRRWATSSPE